MLSSRSLFVALYTMSGAAALVYEVSWTRLLTLQMGHTVSAVSTVLAAFMGGLAIDAWIAGRLQNCRIVVGGPQTEAGGRTLFRDRRPKLARCTPRTLPGPLPARSPPASG